MTAGRLGHLVYDAALDNSLWPELILELTEQMLRLQDGKLIASAESEPLDVADLASHFQRALTISERMVALQEKQSTSASLLDALSVGIALLN